MEHLALGSQGLTVGAQGLGLMGMSAFYGATDETESLATIDRALVQHAAGQPGSLRHPPSIGVAFVQDRSCPPWLAWSSDEGR